MTGDKVLLSFDGPIAHVQLQNPERYNALSRELVEQLHAVMRQLAVERALRAVVIHGGESKAFSSGADLKERQSMSEDEVFGMVHLLRETFNLVERLPVPVIAAIHGMAFGGGCELALACDIRIASEDAHIGLTEVSWAIIPGAGGCIRLPRLVGIARAKELIFTARKLTAAEALEMGLINRVVPRERLVEAARSMAQQIAAQGPLAVRAAKRALNGGAAIEAGLALEFEAYQSVIGTRDRLEGLQAFAEKRPPAYRGE